MNFRNYPPNILLSGGGTGGHIFPAIALADEIKRRLPEANILFIGAEGKMEMRVVPEAGYAIEGLPVESMPRRPGFKMLRFPIKFWRSMKKADEILLRFRPDLAIGTGGYASTPALYVASKGHVPLLIQEQNAYAGLANKLLSKRAQYVCVAYSDMERYFPFEKIALTGNPIRTGALARSIDRRDAKEALGFQPDAKLIFSFGGSQGSRTLNAGWKKAIDKVNVQLLWQTGTAQYADLKGLEKPGVQIVDFITDMALAYAAADLVISRAGALTLSELSIAQKASILVPLPIAAEDHQSKNAAALSKARAAAVLNDTRVLNQLWPVASSLLEDEIILSGMERRIRQFAKPNATHEIVNLALSMIP